MNYDNFTQQFSLLSSFEVANHFLNYLTRITQRDDAISFSLRTDIFQVKKSQSLHFSMDIHLQH